MFHSPSISQQISFQKLASQKPHHPNLHSLVRWVERDQSLTICKSVYKQSLFYLFLYKAYKRMYGEVRKDSVCRMPASTLQTTKNTQFRISIGKNLGCMVFQPARNRLGRIYFDDEICCEPLNVFTCFRKHNP